MADKTFLIGKSPEGPVELTLKRANRHGLIAGATGTGKTVTLQMMAEAFSHAGVAVFAADVKGDLSGISAPSDMNDRWVKRAAETGVSPYTPEAAPVVFWDIYGRDGHPVRTTVSEMGPLLLSRILDLSEAQDGALTIAFKIADEKGLLLLDLKDLRSVFNHVADNADEIGNALRQSSRRQTVARDPAQAAARSQTQGAEHFLRRAGARSRPTSSGLTADGPGLW